MRVHNFQRVWRYELKRSKKGHLWWRIHNEQWLDLHKIYWADKSRASGKFPESRICIIGFIVKDEVIHIRRLSHCGFGNKFGTHCGLVQVPCLCSFSVHKPRDLPMCDRCRIQLEMFMDPKEALRRTTIRREINREARKAKQERRRARKLELASIVQQQNATLTS